MLRHATRLHRLARAPDAPPAGPYLCAKCEHAELVAISDKRAALASGARSAQVRATRVQPGACAPHCDTRATTWLMPSLGVRSVAGRVTVWEGARVLDVQDQDEQAGAGGAGGGEGCLVTVAGAQGERHTIRCRHVVLCTGGLFQEGCLASLLQVNTLFPAGHLHALAQKLCCFCAAWLRRCLARRQKTDSRQTDSRQTAARLPCSPSVCSQCQPAYTHAHLHACVCECLCYKACRLDRAPRGTGSVGPGAQGQ